MPVSSLPSDSELTSLLTQRKEQARSELRQSVATFNAYPNRPDFEPRGLTPETVTDFLLERIPLFSCSDPDISEVYNYRWWMNAKHLKAYREETDGNDYWVYTEFFGFPSHGTKSGAIACPFGHHFYELRWLKDHDTLRSYADYILGPAADTLQEDNHSFLSHLDRPSSHHFTSWLVNGIEAMLKVQPDPDWLETVLPKLERHQQVWDDLFQVQAEGAQTDGLYKSLDLYDGQEFTISATLALLASDGAYAAYTEEDWKSYYLGWDSVNHAAKMPFVAEHEKAFRLGYPQVYLVRPTLNGYCYGNLCSLAALHALQGDSEGSETAQKYRDRAEALKDRMLKLFWNEEEAFFYGYTAADNVAGVRDHELKVREAVGFTPWYFDMIAPSEEPYQVMWEQLIAKEGFWGEKGMSTAECRHPLYNEEAYAWNGRGWPFQNSITHKALANHLRSNDEAGVPSAVTRDHLYRLMEQLTHLHGKERNIQEYYLPSCSETMGGATDYFHSSYVDTIISDLIGVLPQHDDGFVLHPLLPPDAWDHFLLSDLTLHGAVVDILWDKTLSDSPEGLLVVWVNGKIVSTSTTLCGKQILPLS